MVVFVVVAVVIEGGGSLGFAALPVLLFLGGERHVRVSRRHHAWQPAACTCVPVHVDCRALTDALENANVIPKRTQRGSWNSRRRRKSIIDDQITFLSCKDVRNHGGVKEGV